MKTRVAGLIVRYRLIIMILLLLLAVWSVFQIGRTRINYDLTRYLDDATMTKRALQVMTEEFGSSEQLRIVFTGLEEDAVKSCMEKLGGMEEIRAVQHDPESDVTVRDGKTFRLVTLKKALPTVLTSGVILITAGGIIGLQCIIYYISSIGLLLSRGALMSVLLVLTLLPALLTLLDRFVIRKAPGKEAAE